ncbi:MAG: nucleotidyltransferase domain-containing protein [Chloroflexi bacterium]|nr:nucleotidyltransferase domain-containing protein [Chloroflexota bacterium]
MSIVVLILYMLYNYHINQTTLGILSLFRNNYKTSLYLREIAREVKVDAKAVSIQLKRLEKANILTSTKRGKNREYSLNLRNYLTLYHMILAESLTTVEYLNRNFEVKKLVSETTDKLGKTAILFGSYAKENMTPESDIDILIIETKTDSSAFREISMFLNREINIKFMSEKQFSNGLVSNDPLIAEIVTSHIILKGIDNVCNILWEHYAK